MTIATGVSKKVAYKKETTWGTAAGTGSGIYLRRVSSDLGLKKDTYQSAEIRTDYQIAAFAHGMRKVQGTLRGELSPGSYSLLMAAALRSDFAAVSALTGLSLTIAGSGPTYTVTRGSGSFLTGGIKVGMVTRITAGAVDANNSNKNLFVVTLTATVMTVIPWGNGTMTAEGPIASCTVTPTGKVSYTPLTGHTNDSFTVEHWHSDIAQSEYFTGCRVSTLAFGLPSTGMATVDIGFMGKDMTTGTAQYFVSPTAASSNNVITAVNGAVRGSGAALAVVTGATINVNGNHAVGATIGSNTTPDVFPGRVNVSGQLTAYFDSVTLRDAFVNASEVSVNLVMYNGTTATADFVALTMSRVMFGDAAKNDVEQGLSLTLPFQALLNTSGGSGTDSEQTTLWLQDSLA